MLFLEASNQKNILLEVTIGLERFQQNTLLCVVSFYKNYSVHSIQKFKPWIFMVIFEWQSNFREAY